MKTIAIYNRKGGTGKTVTAGNTAIELAQYGRVLMVDCDSQADLSGWISKGARYELAEVLGAAVDLGEAITNVRPNLDLLASFALGGELQTFAETELHKNPFAFMNLRRDAEALGYDYMMLDLAPAHSLLERYALGIADSVILVAQAEQFSRDALELAEAFVREIRATMRAPAEIVSIVANRVNRAYAEHEAVLEILEALGYPVYVVGQSTGISNAIAAGVFAREHYAGNPWLRTYQRLAEGLVNGEHETAYTA